MTEWATRQKKRAGLKEEETTKQPERIDRHGLSKQLALEEGAPIAQWNRGQVPSDCSHEKRGALRAAKRGSKGLKKRRKLEGHEDMSVRKCLST